jgi:integrase
MGAVKTALREGYHRGDIDHDPIAGVARLHEDPKETGIFTKDEIKKIFSDPSFFFVAQKHYGIIRGKQPNNLAYVFFLVCALTGERPKAVLALHWEDFIDGLLYFRQTKTQKNGRYVPVCHILNTALTQLKDSAVNKNGYIFGYEDGTGCTQTWYHKRFNTMMKRTQILKDDAEGRRRIPYSFKHSLITHLLDAGADEILVREYVGHAHTYGSSRVLTPVQAKYKHRQAEKLRKLLPMIETLYDIKTAPGVSEISKPPHR